MLDGVALWGGAQGQDFIFWIDSGLTVWCNPSTGCCVESWAAIGEAVRRVSARVCARGVVSRQRRASLMCRVSQVVEGPSVSTERQGKWKNEAASHWASQVKDCRNIASSLDKRDVIRNHNSWGLGPVWLLYLLLVPCSRNNDQQEWRRRASKA